MSIKNIWQDFLEYFRHGIIGINNELFQKDLPVEESLDKLPIIQDEVKNDTEQQREQTDQKNEEKNDEKNDEKQEEKNEIIDLSKGDEVVDEVVIQIINNENDESDGNENECKEK